ncbi:MAG: hypothetical protein E7652_04105 [Ruminococcaceae bacterium]|nr:hypothetical protein [Oscillospiraceae bacterium]
MPCAMMHLQCARLYNENADIAFFIGNIAPDCIDEREFKDRNHLRIYKGEERLNKLHELARALDLSRPYQLGVLLHLYTDMCWDRGPMAEHKRSYTGDDWFHDYRQEIRYISKYMYKNEAWAPVLWDEIDNAPPELYSDIDYYPTDKIKGYIEHNVRTHPLPPAIPSKAFPNEVVYDFCKKSVESFGLWLINNNIEGSSK